MQQKKKIKVLHLITEIEPGGAENLLLDLSEQISKERFDISIGYLKGKGTLAGRFKKLGTEVTFFNMRLRFDIFCLFKLAKFMKKNCFDIIHTHLIDADIFGFFAAKIAGIPVIVSTKHNTDEFRKKKTLPVLLDSFVANNSNQIIAISNAVRDFLKKYQNVRADKIEVIHNGVNVKKFNLKGNKQKVKIDLNLNPKDIIIGTVARFDKQKGYKYLIEAIPEILESFSNTHFVFVGTGRLKAEMENKVIEMKIKNKVSFLGARDDIADILQGFDIFVLSSLWEGLGIVLLEAQAAGLPVVATEVDGIIEAVEKDKSGVLVSSGDPRALSQAIVDLLNNAQRFQSLGRNGQEFVARNFRIELMRNKMETLYDRLIGK